MVGVDHELINALNNVQPYSEGNRKELCLEKLREPLSPFSAQQNCSRQCQICG